MPIQVIVHKLLQTLYLTLVCADFLGKLYRVALLAEIMPLALAVALDSQNILAHNHSLKLCPPVLACRVPANIVAQTVQRLCGTCREYSLHITGCTLISVYTFPGVHLRLLLHMPPAGLASTYRAVVPG